ncbi:MAG: RDD family protein [Opitutales bacterium]|nr:RDD family protein [Opitutales bacterium]
MSDKEWYFARNNQPEGPVSESELRGMLQSNHLSAETLIWAAGMPDWQPARQVTDFADLFQEATLRPAAEVPPVITNAPGEPHSSAGDFENHPSFTGYAGFWKRVVAAIIDGFVLLPIGLIAGAFLGFAAAGSGASHEGMELMGNMLGVLIGWLYHALMESSHRQATLGKMAMGIVVTDLNGQQISFGRASGRFFGMYLSAFIFLIGFIMVAFTAKKQGLHDILASCLVVNQPTDRP